MNSQLNVGHVSVFEENDDEFIIRHRPNKRRIVEDEVEVIAEGQATGEVKANVAKQ